MKNNVLADKIREFVWNYAKIGPNWFNEDVLDGKYTGPDPYQLLDAADLIEQGIKPTRVWSEWGSGCYGKYSDKAAMKLHDDLMAEIYNFQP